MKLSAKARYGLKAMYCLGQNKMDEPMSLHTLAELSDVTAPYLEKLLGLLKNKGLIQTVRGVTGGYYLAKTPENISVGEMIRALEGDVLQVDCIDNCNKKGCPNKDLFLDIYQEIDSILNNMTLQNILDNNKED